MYHAIVTVQRHGEFATRDLEVPANIPADRLAAMIAAAMGWDRAPDGGEYLFQIEAPPGRPLAGNESLGSAGVWDGAQVVLRQVGVRRHVPPRERRPTGPIPAPGPPEAPRAAPTEGQHPAPPSGRRESALRGWRGARSRDQRPRAPRPDTDRSRTDEDSDDGQLRE